MRARRPIHARRTWHFLVAASATIWNLGCASDDASCPERNLTDAELHIGLDEYPDWRDHPENQLDEDELELAAIGTEVSQFAGYFYEGNTVIVRVTVLCAADAAIMAMEIRPIASEVLAGNTVRAETADYSLTQLFAYRAPIRRGVMNVEGVVTFGISYVANRLEVGVVDSDAEAAASDLVERAGVPGDAVIYPETGPITF